MLTWFHLVSWNSAIHHGKSISQVASGPRMLKTRYTHERDIKSGVWPGSAKPSQVTQPTHKPMGKENKICYCKLPKLRFYHGII